MNNESQLIGGPDCGTHLNNVDQETIYGPCHLEYVDGKPIVYRGLYTKEGKDFIYNYKEGNEVVVDCKIRDYLLPAGTQVVPLKALNEEDRSKMISLYNSNKYFFIPPKESGIPEGIVLQISDIPADALNEFAITLEDLSVFNIRTS